MPGYARLEAFLDSATRKFSIYPVTTLLHVLPGALILALGLLQFSRRVRSRHPALHRVSGRVLLSLALVFVFASFFFGLFDPYGGALEASATVLFGGFLLFAGARAYAAIRRRDIARHREWMIRMFATGLGIATIRVFAMIGILAFNRGPTMMPTQRDFALMLWLGFSITLLGAELWIRRSRRSFPPQYFFGISASAGPTPGIAKAGEPAGLA